MELAQRTKDVKVIKAKQHKDRSKKQMIEAKRKEKQ
jgi:hypothetical protein